MSPGPQRTTATVDPQDVAERQRAARALMLTPLLHSEGSTAEDFRLVRRHRAELVRTFAEGLGYRLDVGPVAARLYKAGLGRDPGRPVRRRSGAAFTPRTYALLCLTLAALTRSRGQLLVDELVQQVRSAAVDAGIALDLDGASDRRALNAAFLLLVALGMLRERDGDLEHWADQRTQSLLEGPTRPPRAPRCRPDRLGERRPGFAQPGRPPVGRRRCPHRHPPPASRVAGHVGRRPARRPRRVVGPQPQPRA